jgi:hypothetical protein
MTALQLHQSQPAPLIEDEDLFPEEASPIGNTMDVTRKIQTVRMIEAEIERYALQDRESRAFYAQRTSRCEERIQALKVGLLGYLQAHGLKNVATPAGTAYQKRVVTRTWPADDVLVAWAKSNLPAAIRLKEEPDKRLLADHLVRTGEVVPGYAEEESTRVYLR